MANINIGRKASVLMFEKISIISGKYTLTGCQKLNQKHISASSYKNLDSTKNLWKIRRGKVKKEHYDKNEEKEGKSYEAGAFWTLQLNFIIADIVCYLPGVVFSCYCVIWKTLLCT